MMNREALIQRVQDGLAPEYLFFWGHQPLPDGAVGKSCFSQWYAAAFTVAAERYPTAEHFMMAEKARLFGDEEVRAEVLRAPDPREAKSLGRKVRNFEEDRWIELRSEIVIRANEAKFAQNVPLGEFLLNTGNRVLVEASPRDCIWGIGLSADNPRSQDPRQWRGLNLLGFALMEVRERMRGSG